MRVLDRTAQWIWRAWGRSPHGFQLTLARAVLALSTLLVLCFNDTATLLHRPSAEPAPSSCEGVSAAGAFCVIPLDFELTRLLLIALVLPALVGLLPAVSAPLHAYAAFTVAQNTVGIEGGDYLTSTFTILLCVVCITDWRLNGWRTRANGIRSNRFVPANIIFVALQVQVAYMYIEAATVKQAHPVWSEGSALWYWAQHPSFGARPEIRDVLAGVLSNPVLLQAATWGVIVAEYVLAFAVLAARRRSARWTTLALSIALHLVFSLVLGLVTFGVSVLGAMLVISWRSGDAVPWWVFRLAMQRQTPAPEPDRERHRANMIG